MSANESVTWTTTHGDTVEVWYSPRFEDRPVEVGGFEEIEEVRLDRWRYRIRATNNKIVETGSEGYTRKAAAIRAALRHHPRADPQAITDGVADAIEDYVSRRHGVFGAPDAAWLLEFLADNGLSVVQSSAPRVDQ